MIKKFMSLITCCFLKAISNNSTTEFSEESCVINKSNTNIVGLLNIDIYLRVVKTPKCVEALQRVEHTKKER